MLRSLLVVLACASTASAADRPRRVVFLGDSITYAGQYVEYVETIMRLRDPAWNAEILDLGLPSETVSGLSEPGHAGGSFPRPTLHERLDRVLATTKPDLVVACYGMNDGVYHPYSAERFAKYQEGIKLLRRKTEAAGAKILHLTPPVFDAEPIKAKTLPAGRAEYRQPYEGYDEVLNLYAAWLLAEKGEQWSVVDLHGPMARALGDARAKNPAFRFAGDGVHADAAGHWIIAKQLLMFWGVPSNDLTEASAGARIAKHPKGPDVLKLVQKKQRMLKDAYLNAVGHKRPGMAKGLPVEEARRQAEAIDGEIYALLGRKPGRAAEPSNARRED